MKSNSKYKTISFGYIVGELGKGGQETQLMYLIESIIKNGHKCALVIWTYNDNKFSYLKKIQDFGVQTLILNEESFFKKIIKIRKFLKFNEVVTFQSYSSYLNFITFVSCLNSSIIPIGGFRNQLNQIRETTSFLKFWGNLIFPINKVSNNNFFNDGYTNLLVSFFLRKTKVITNHLDVSKFQVYHNQNLENPNILTCSIGRLYKEKSIDVLIKAIHLTKLNNLPLVHFHAGAGDLLNELVDLVKDLDIEDRFIFVGEVDSTAKFLEDKKFLIHSSTYEGYPNVIMEAFASGKPVVTTNCGDVSLIVDNNINGFIVNVGDFNGLYTNILTLCQNPDLMQKFSINSRLKAEDKFDIKHLYEDIMSYYKELLKLK
jgi:glycosyltransferase involved in cell wall biosynthesis